MKPIHTIPAMIFLATSASLSAAPDVSPSDHAAHVAAAPGSHPSTADSPSGDPALSHDLAAMREKVAKLETALGSKNGAPADSAGMAMPGQAPAAGTVGMPNSDQGTTNPDQGTTNSDQGTTNSDQGMANSNQKSGKMAGKGKMKMGGASMSGGSPNTPGGGMDKMDKMDRMMSMMETMMSMKGGAMPTDGASMTPATSSGMGKGMDMDKTKMGGMGMNKMKKRGASMSGGSSDTSGGGMNKKDKLDRMMSMMEKMMSMEGGAMPMDGAMMAPATSGGMGKGMAMDKMKMPGMGMDRMAMDKMKMAGMMGMPPMGAGAPGAMPQSALPGFPGTSHLYHLGATDFFLDHEGHIALTMEQTAALNQAKEKAALAKSTADRVIQQAEQELWALTASDQPDITAIEAKTAEIGKLTGETRVAFIRAVGEASKILTDKQRKILTGYAPPAPAVPMAAPTPAMAPMKDM